jgi:hypothetical protein
MTEVVLLSVTGTLPSPPGLSAGVRRAPNVTLEPSGTVRGIPKKSSIAEHPGNTLKTSNIQGSINRLPSRTIPNSLHRAFFVHLTNAALDKTMIALASTDHYNRSVFGLLKCAGAA